VLGFPTVLSNLRYVKTRFISRGIPKSGLFCIFYGAPVFLFCVAYSEDAPSE
jgi:hypothetical protein